MVFTAEEGEISTKGICIDPSILMHDVTEMKTRIMLMITCCTLVA